MTTITPEELAPKLTSGSLTLIDVRTPAEFREVHVTGARNVPLDTLAPAELAAETQGAPLYLICKSGGRSQMACDRLAAAGVMNIVNVAGGTSACVAAGLPVERGRSVISLERQVRIAAGSLVLVGVALGALVHPVGYGLAGFIGGGLLFAGVTDTCGMGMLLAKMPWNR